MYISLLLKMINGFSWPAKIMVSPFNFFSQFFMNFLVKIYKKRYDKHNETLWTTDFFNSVFCLVSCSSKNQVPYFKAVTDSNLTRLLLRKKKKKKKSLKKNAFRSGLPICHELWDIAFIFFSLSQSTNKLSRIYVGLIENINGLIIMTQIAF